MGLNVMGNVAGKSQRACTLEGVNDQVKGVIFG
jgi:hypothetical protein